MTNKTKAANKSTVKDGLPTAEKSFNDFAKSMGYQTWSDMRNAFCMDGFALNDRIFKAAEAHTAALQERVKELESVAQQFIEAVDREEIIIQENFDNDGWENCGGRLYESFKNALKK